MSTADLLAAVASAEVDLYDTVALDSVPYVVM